MDFWREMCGGKLVGGKQISDAMADRRAATATGDGGGDDLR